MMDYPEITSFSSNGMREWATTETMRRKALEEQERQRAFDEKYIVVREYLSEEDSDAIYETHFECCFDCDYPGLDQDGEGNLYRETIMEREQS